MVKVTNTEMVVSSGWEKPWRCETIERAAIQNDTVRPIGKE